MARRRKSLEWMAVLVVNEVEDTTDTFVNRPGKAERAAESV